MSIAEFQRLIEEIYGAKDKARGTADTFMWFTEEVGELSRALRRQGRAELVVAGGGILEAVCSTWNAGRLRVADRGVREGILLALSGAVGPGGHASSSQ